MTRLPVIAALIAAFATSASAQPAPAGVVRTATLAATVEAIDLVSRQAVLRGEDGRLVTLELAPEVRNLRQVKPGDRVTVTYEESVAAAISAPGDKRPPLEAATVLGRSKPGDRPGGAAGRMVRARVTIDAASAAGDSVTFTGPRGRQVVAPVADAGMQQFVRGLKPGDVVDVVFAEAVGVRVEPAAR
jgi:hypothetical protein